MFSYPVSGLAPAGTTLERADPGYNPIPNFRLPVSDRLLFGVISISQNRLDAACANSPIELLAYLLYYRIFSN